MITQSIVILKNDIELNRSIINYALDGVDGICDTYSEQYGEAIISIDRELSKIEKKIDDNKQVLLEFTLDSLAVYKEIIYIYMRDNFKNITIKDMNGIISILKRVDNWVDEYLNINGGMHVQAYGYRDYESGNRRL